ncbi:MAG TPA: alpha-glucuronidase family glycosyl hydrolase [Candidatus Eisenbacteria bacterium]|nr:alpha-glucuronidase family glycosyl hydrolase [Candidatus Eisenbacteria bacterium]
MRLASLRPIQLSFADTDCSLRVVFAKSYGFYSPKYFLHRVFCWITLLFLSVPLASLSAKAETGREGWLRYKAKSAAEKQPYISLPKDIVVVGDSPVLISARQELIRGLTSMLGVKFRITDEMPRGAIFLGRSWSMNKLLPDFQPRADVSEEGFWLNARETHGEPRITIVGGSDRGVLYGVFALLGKIERGEDISALDEVENPRAKVRWVDQWDNLDGTIERGYAGASIFFEGGKVRADLTRASDYGRLLASVGINGCNVNNVNANPRTLQSDFLLQVARIAGAFRPWGVRLSLSVDLSSPKTIGGLDTFDPLDPRVAAWWSAKADEIYGLIPDFGGFTVKADSEGRVGPSSYGRTPADAANAVALSLAPHGGVLFYRAFVYNRNLDWRDPKADRARAAYDIFHPLDGKFDDNVIIQIKHGPVDFQAREPVSPLFSGLEKTNEAIELQVTQEYTGQQRHLVYLAPMWKEVLDFDLRAGADKTPVKDMVSGKVFRRPFGGYVAVVNVGMDENWLAHPFAMANLYAYGRLAWNPDLSPGEMCEAWARLTFGNDPTVVKTVSESAMKSWRTYENYTGFLGTQTLTDITGSHYGPNIESSEENGWGQWHRADHVGIGMDRSAATGTGFAGQYQPGIAKMYESVATTPDELMLFFHHVPYATKLHSGKTVIQYVYDSHYEGANEVAESVRDWKTLKGKIDDQRYSDVLSRLEYQAGHAIVWRDAICNYFLRLSGIPDAKGRAGSFPNRIEAENMALSGYVPVEVTPWENASGGKAIECSDAKGCSASFRVSGEPGKYEIDVQYFDQNNGKSRFRVLVNNNKVDEWAAEDCLPAKKIGGDSSTRRRIYELPLQPGDEIRLEGVPDGQEKAGLDYVEIFPK